ncbi:MAG: hypothetical protein RLY14_732, partial [Planctomycetota bacterium]
MLPILKKNDAYRAVGHCTFLLFVAACLLVDRQICVAQVPNSRAPIGHDMAHAAANPTTALVANPSASQNVATAPPVSAQPIAMGPNIVGSYPMMSIETSGESILRQQVPYPGGCPNCMRGIDCRDHCGQSASWDNMRPIEFQPLLHGEFVGPIRLPAMVDYRMRPGD